MRLLGNYIIVHFAIHLMMVLPTEMCQTEFRISSLQNVLSNSDSDVNCFERQKRYLDEKIRRLKRFLNMGPSFLGIKLSTVRKMNRYYQFFTALRDTLDEFPWRIQKEVDKMMKNMYYKFVMNETDNVNLSCENHVTNMIKGEYSKSIFRWRHNSKPVQMDPSRMVLYKGTLVIRNLQIDDTGVYTCQIEYKPGNRKTVGMYSVLVKTDEVNLWVKETMEMKLWCNSHFLGAFYPNATREWFYNSVLFDARNKTNASLATPEVFRNVLLTYNGTWVCRVVNEEPPRIWYTALYNVFVLPPPALHEVILMYILAHKAKTFFIVVGVCFVSFIIIAVLAHYGRDYQDRRAKKKEIMKEQLMAVLGGKAENKEENKASVADDVKDEERQIEAESDSGASGASRASGASGASQIDGYLTDESLVSTGSVPKQKENTETV